MRLLTTAAVALGAALLSVPAVAAIKAMTLAELMAMSSDVLHVRIVAKDSFRLDWPFEGAVYTRLTVDGESLDIPVKLKVHDSIFVPLAKWAMLLTGNYRCVKADEMQSIKDAVHSDLALSKSVYDWVVSVCESIGADRNDLVPFEKYAAAANGLTKPSSAARALLNGAPNIERADCIVRTIAGQKGLKNETVDKTVVLVESWLERNRAKAKA